MQRVLLTNGPDHLKRRDQIWTACLFPPRFDRDRTGRKAATATSLRHSPIAAGCPNMRMYHKLMHPSSGLKTHLML